jgi:hypothetical protein
MRSTAPSLPWPARVRGVIMVRPRAKARPMLKDFYLAFASVCFPLLGLWIIVVQTRHAEWRESAIHRRRA